MKLGLGTVEFAAKTGKHGLSVPLDEACRILEVARQSGIEVLDTAAQAGNSETILGECLPERHSFKIVAKTPTLEVGYATSHQVANQMDQLESALHQSLSNLRQTKLYALMMSYQDDLAPVQHEKLHQRLTHFKEQKLIEKVGVSVADATQIERQLAVYRPDIVQLPLNVLDERLLRSGHLTLLKQQGIEIHVRDIFLQGVLLDPTRLHPWFWPIRKLMDDYHDYLIREGLTPMEGALNFATGIPEVDYALVGVQSTHQLQEVIGALQTGIETTAFARFACPDERFINPLCWNLYE